MEGAAQLHGLADIGDAEITYAARKELAHQHGRTVAISIGLYDRHGGAVARKALDKLYIMFKAVEIDLAPRKAESVHPVSPRDMGM